MRSLIVAVLAFAGVTFAANEVRAQAYWPADSNGYFYKSDPTVNGLRIFSRLSITCNVPGDGVMNGGFFGEENFSPNDHFNDNQLSTIAGGQAKLLDDNFVRALLAHIVSEDRACALDPKKGNLAPNNYRVFIDEGSNSVASSLVAVMFGDKGTWKIFNYYRDRVSKQQTVQLAAASNLRRLAALRVANVQSFVARFGIKSFEKSSAIIANPFLFKGTVVGIRGTFVRMLSENEALFSGECCGNNLIVSSVPATRFRGNEQVVLALKVRGTRVYEQTTIPDVQYLGDHACTMNGCQDFYRPN